MNDVRERIRELLPDVKIIGFSQANEIAEECCWILGTSMRAVRSESRVRHLVQVRHIIWWVVRTLTEESGVSYPDLGDLFNRHHSSIIHGVQHVEDLRKSDPAVREVTDLLLGEVSK